MGALETPNRDSAKQLLIVLPAAHLNMTLPLPQNLTILGTSPGPPHENF